VTPATPPPTATPLPTAAVPFINLSPNAGAGGTVVTVSGNNFPANTTLGIYLAAFDGEFDQPGPSQRYATGATDGGGNYSITFTLPEEWPNGDSIDSGLIVVLVATNDFTVQASALLDYTNTTAARNEGSAAAPTEAPPTPTPLPTDTPVPTDTPAPPTDTPIPTDTPAPTDTPVPTDTPAPPTDTPVPTDTPAPTDTPVPTDTPAPPTDTPVPTETPTTPPEDTPTATETTPPPSAPITDTETITDTGTVTGTMILR
jgi:type VI secretion system secreted protein VgrG